MSKTVGSSFSAYYAQLRSVARVHLARERRARVSPETLAHEVFLKMQGKDLHFATMEQFLRYASDAMQHHLVDMGRKSSAAKRKVDYTSLSKAGNVADLSLTPPECLVAWGRALERLEALDKNLAQVFAMRVFFDADDEVIARTLSVSVSTVQRDWVKAKAFVLGLV